MAGGRLGPFTVSAGENCRYQLRDSQGQLIQGGAFIEEKHLKEWSEADD